MKIILSPSKTQKINRIENMGIKQEVFAKETAYLVNLLKKLKTDEIKEKMKISDKIAKNVLLGYKHFYESESGHAVASYTGIAYRNLDVKSFSKEDILYMENTLVILSALYGVLTPYTGIRPYRLDMTMSVLKDKSLYEYWKNSVNSYFEKEDIIINLASKEFSKMLKKPLVDIEFYEFKNNRLVQISTNSKKARGEMARQLILQKITEKEKIQNITFSGYEFDGNLSEDNKLVFVKKL